MSVFSKLFGLLGSGGKPGVPRINVTERFELYGKSGQGSMSRVHRAKDKKHNRIVCLKILDKKKTQEFEARFPGLNKPSEGEICVRLDHKNIVKTYEHGITPEGEPVLVMEWLDGIGLNFILSAGGEQLDGKRVDVLTQLADGLEYLHAQKFLHRDICPRNVMIGKKGEVKYIDFGLTIPYTPPFCKPGNRTGTANYLAPEIIKRLTTDHRVDLFALGVMAYEIFTNTLPWEKSESMENLLRVMNTPPTDPRVYRKDLDPATTKLLLRAVQTDPNKRFQTAAEFREALEALPRQDW
jgi:serine/threonine protein kinase